jgi:hypothetical protein
VGDGRRFERLTAYRLESDGDKWRDEDGAEQEEPDGAEAVDASGHALILISR